MFDPIHISGILPQAISYEQVHSKCLVISADYMFHYLWNICVRTQLELFECDDTLYRFELYKWQHSKKLRRTKPMPTKPKNS